MTTNADPKTGSIYFWTLYRSHREPETGFGTLDHLSVWLDKCDLPGTTPADWIAMDLALSQDDNDHSTYKYDNGVDKWTVTLQRTDLEEVPGQAP